MIVTDDNRHETSKSSASNAVLQHALFDCSFLRLGRKSTVHVKTDSVTE